MAMDVVVQRLQVGDVISADFPEHGGGVEATVVRDITRTESAVRVTLRIGGSPEFVREWALGEMVTVVRGPWALADALSGAVPGAQLAPEERGDRVAQGETAARGSHHPNRVMTTAGRPAMLVRTLGVTTRKRGP
jgi:hypothetical protein